MPPITTQIQSRKERRKRERKKKRRHDHLEQPKRQIDDKLIRSGKHFANGSETDSSKKVSTSRKSNESSSKNKKRKKQTSGEYKNIDSDVAAALRRDDEEIAELEEKLGFGKSKSKEKDKLYKEYAKEECYGDDFGDFLDDLDEMMVRVTGKYERRSGDTNDRNDGDYSEDEDDQSSSVSSEGQQEERYEEHDRLRKSSKRKEGKLDHYRDVDPNVAAALRRDDEEIAELEAKMGLGNKKSKEKLHKEYASQECYGDDFGDFLDDLDDMIVRVKMRSEDGDHNEHHKVGSVEGSEDESEDEELVPMKDPHMESESGDEGAVDETDCSSKLNWASEKAEPGDDASGGGSIDGSADGANNDSPSEEESDEDKSENSSSEAEPDHDFQDTYRPSKGEDIYGNKAEESLNDDAPKKYIPPHLRRKIEEENDEDRQAKLNSIQRALNNALNRLSEDSLIPVAQSLAAVYASNPTQMVNEMVWKNTKHACISAPILMTGLIPVYVACLVGVHVQTGDTVQLGEYLLEKVVRGLWEELARARNDVTEDYASDETNDDHEVVDRKKKETCNLILLLCYLYNYSIVHCSFLYDLIRSLIENFSELDIECLLLLLSHCGRSLRSDDPLALKEIVLMVQKQQSQVKSSNGAVSTSRVDYMVSAIMDLKNNKRRQQDIVYLEKAAKLRKLLGRIKSSAANSSTGKTSSESSLRISLQDMLEVETKGRWWKVGASWVGNQYRFSDSMESGHNNNNNGEKWHATQLRDTGEGDEQDEKLLRLASKYRMNTDRKRAIFCIIMGCADCEDAFEKLCRSGMLQNRSERDTVRVLMECCGNEKSYNKFYGHLAAQICEYQPQCKFSFQLAFWDIFKQFETTKVRKAANLAKLLFNLTAVHHVLKLTSVVKAIDLSFTDDIDEATMIFLTICFTSVLDYFDDPSMVQAMLRSNYQAQSLQDSDANNFGDDQEGVQAGLLVFFMETLKASPKNKKGSKFRSNYKAAIKALDTDNIENMF